MAGKHRVRTPRRAAGFVVAGGAAVAATSVVAGVAHAEPGVTWDAVAACKSGGNWAASSTNDYSKEPQFTLSTFPANPGTGISQGVPRSQQITAAQRVLDTQSAGTSPACGQRAALAALVAPVTPATSPRHASRAKHAAPAEPATSPPRHAAPEVPAAPATPTGSMTVYTVQTGDTLAQIAANHAIPGGWQRMWDENRDVLVDPNTIAVGEHLRIPAAAPAATPPFTESIIHTTSDVIAGITGKPAPILMPAPAKPATRIAPPAEKPVEKPAEKPAKLTVKAAGTSGGFAARAVTAAVAQVGTPYRYGGAAPGGFDCSGLVQFAFKRAGISLPRTAAAQATVGKPVSLDNLQPGDLLFFYRPVGHVVVYVGNGKIAEASEPGKPVHVRKLYTNGFVGARRVI